MQPDIKVGTIVARPGEMASGILDLGTSTIPITVFNGKHPGPVLALVAGKPLIEKLASWAATVVNPSAARPPSPPEGVTVI